jgi:hypothetical protein
MEHFADYLQMFWVIEMKYIQIVAVLAILAMVVAPALGAKKQNQGTDCECETCPCEGDGAQIQNNAPDEPVQTQNNAPDEKPVLTQTQARKGQPE